MALRTTQSQQYASILQRFMYKKFIMGSGGYT